MHRHQSINDLLQYPCISMYTYVYSCKLMFTHVYSCILMYIATHVYPCKLIFILVYPYIPMHVYPCFIHKNMVFCPALNQATEAMLSNLPIVCYTHQSDIANQIIGASLKIIYTYYLYSTT